MKLSFLSIRYSGHYLKALVRNAFRNRFYSALSLIGLSLGFVVFIYALIYAHYETRFEDFHQKADRIYRVTYRFDNGEGFQVHWARTPADFVNNLPNDIPAIDKFVRFQNQARKYVRIGEEKFVPRHAYVADSGVFDIFDFRLLKGNPATALASPRSVVISESLARAYFGDADPMNQEIFVIGDFDESETPFHVTGVMADLPRNTHLPVDLLMSFADDSERTGWAYCYALLQSVATIDQVEAEMDAFIKKYNTNPGPGTIAFVFQPIRDIHLHSNLAREIVPNGNAFYVKVVAIAGILILIIAVINFMNLNTAMALRRSREIGVRKLLGAGPAQLVTYLLFESVVWHLGALVVGGAVAYTLYPFVQQLVPFDLLMSIPMLALLLVGVAVLCGLLAGIYPVVLLISGNIVKGLRGAKGISLSRKEGLFSLRRVMVTLQFCISIMLAGSTLIAWSQFRYLQEKNLGLNREQVVAIPGVPDKVKDRYEAFRNRVTSLPGIHSVGACMEVPSREIRDSGPVLLKGVNDDPTTAPVMDVQVIDPNFVNVMELEFVAGTNISADPNSHEVPVFTETFTLQDYLKNRRREYLINETAMRQLGWQDPQEALGQEINWQIGDLVLAFGPIKGVVRDFHQESLRNQVDPVVMVYEPVWLRTFLVKTDGRDVTTTMAGLASAWEDLFPLYPLEYHFLDELYDNLYKGERVQLQLLYILSGLAIFIAFTGLVAMVAYTLRTRVRELAIRKVLGATISDLMRMMSKEYVAVLFIGGLVAIPASVYAVRQWLSGFAYRIDISPVAYVVTLLSIGLMLLATIGLQTLRSDDSNPADVLRSE